MGDEKSETKKDSNIVERITGSHHYKTTISDGEDKVEAEGRTAKEAEERASERWDEKKNG